MKINWWQVCFYGQCILLTYVSKNMEMLGSIFFTHHTPWAWCQQHMWTYFLHMTGWHWTQSCSYLRSQTFPSTYTAPLSTCGTFLVPVALSSCSFWLTYLFSTCRVGEVSVLLSRKVPTWSQQLLLPSYPQWQVYINFSKMELKMPVLYWFSFLWSGTSLLLCPNINFHHSLLQQIFPDSEKTHVKTVFLHGQVLVLVGWNHSGRSNTRAEWQEIHLDREARRTADGFYFVLWCKCDKPLYRLDCWMEDRQQCRWIPWRTLA